MLSLKKVFAASVAAGVLVFAPVSIQTNSLLAGGTESLVRLNEACGQSTSCVYATNYICSTYNADYNNYKCSSGCEKTQPA